VTFAIHWAQWRSIRILRFGGGRLGALFSAFTQMLWYGCWAVAAVGVAEFASDAAARAQVERLLPAVLVFVMLYWQLVPILVASLGAALDMKKLVVYPIPVENLFWVDVMLRVTTGLEMLLVMTGATLGLIWNPAFGGVASAPRIVAPVAVFVLLNLLLAAGLRGVVERILGQKRLREVFVVLLVMIAATPQLLLVTGVPNSTLHRVANGASSALWPWTAVARIALAPDLPKGPAIAPWAVLLAWTTAAYWLGRRQFESNLNFDAQAAQATSASDGSAEDSWRSKLFRLPSLVLPDPVGAMVEKELRTLSRTPRFRLVFIMGFTFGLVVWLPIAFHRGLSDHGGAADNFLTLVCLYSLLLLGQVTYWNSFGFDRSAVQAYFAWPPPISRALVAKNLAAALFIFLEVMAVTAACLLLRMAPSPGKILEAYLVTPAVALYLFAAGNLSSVHAPRPLNPDRATQGGPAGRMQAILFFIYPVALLPVLLAYGARYAFHSEVAFYVLLGFAAMLGAGLYGMALESARDAAERRKEQIITELSRNDGPVATG
jgi:ABC-2 type transport system permease protein